MVLEDLVRRAMADAGNAVFGALPHHVEIECGGYMGMGSALTDADGTRHEMLGLLGLETCFAQGRMHLGYCVAELAAPMLGHHPSVPLRSHEFHYSTILAQRGHTTGTSFHLIAEGR
jgi:cobyrinic acid a,c-diamide synthase